MQILIYGIGGVGGYFGGMIANAGYDVSMIGRGKHLEAIQQNGLFIESIKGDFKVVPKIATDDLKNVSSPDLVILGVKSWQLKDAATALKAIIKEDTIVLPLQNGAGNVEQLLQVLPKKNVIAGLCRIVSFIESPGKIKHASFEPEIIFGEIDNSQSKRIHSVKEIFDRSGIQNTIPEEIELEVWKKFLFIVTISGIGGLTRVPIGKIRESDYLFDLMQKTAREIVEVANAKKIPLTLEHVKRVFETIANQPFQTTASTQRDLMDGRPSELENFNGFIVQEGARLGIPTPVNKFIYECLLPMEQKALNL
ncbi:ketopantoate reductase family protein [Gillisia limnaea]|uniref:2-dehydropantoate 2-reductase n=1 Tax=Gillisia limnaea (strain DSM 15749 / LMG 21470 / R-8282) TaxID=865937 RepID=H2BRW1_GILLR|nr:2-dehydropantoate 2-reductase [Gillisia limnaea]EHQ02448.1 ketopantoate reductase [Gillisia limnaea DSM 15749]